jgi:hypothetical protein
MAVEGASAVEGVSALDEAGVDKDEAWVGEIVSEEVISK